MAVHTSAANTGATEMEIISSIVQDELIRSAKLRPTITDRSDMAEKGIKVIDLPRFESSFNGPADQNEDGATVTVSQTAVFDVDTIDLSDWTSIVYEVPDRVGKQTRINLEGELAESAGKSYGNYMDDQIIVQLRLGAAANLHGLGGLATGNGTEVSLADVAKARRLLNRAEADQDSRYMVVPPEMEETIINLDNFRNADKYGSREALLEGEVGRIYGFIVIVHNGLAANEACFYQKKCVAVAVQQEVRFETQRMELGLQSTQYSFALGMGQTVLQKGELQVYLLGA